LLKPSFGFGANRRGAASIGARSFSYTSSHRTDLHYRRDSSLTLAHYSEGRFFLALGAGENKQNTPYGVTRDRPFGRLEEVLKLLKLWFSTDEPVDFDGKFWQVKNRGISTPAYRPGVPTCSWPAVRGRR
jgi:phthiodiolone/phenolphthiodiolone dimycocerosates ketoreductase